ncbi:hypothetical protein H2200_001173 [Cladophialophora chaetospira]|uniref:Enoyl reductase (ER) domain-containing protein n=1 Tax=Cladophialophora chaetospira TaxID=386627 RepID=A0AA39CNT6_9EURO|nr:hypothetical protein H2200_001173 [Cladophialophora chaetospira]
MTSTECPAIVTYAPQPEPDLRCEQVLVSTSLEDHQLLVQMVATGLCQLEVHLSSDSEALGGSKYPRILGHEGAGYVKAVGAKVEAAKVGDAVVLSYDYCEACRLCSQSQPAYCENFHQLNILGDNGSKFRAIGNPHSPIVGGFFGQSSLSSLSVVSERAVVRISELLKDEGELKLFGPLGCGFQTGAGAVTIAGSAASGDVVVVTGLGAVGFGAIMAAKIAGCKTIIAIDQVDSRLGLAKQIGATAVLTTADRRDLRKELSNCLGDRRLSLVIETTGAPNVIEVLVDCMGHRGRYIQIGIPNKSNSGASINLPVLSLVKKRIIVEGNAQGSATATEFIPRMIQWYREGKFPIDKLIQPFPADNFASALRGMRDGSVIKPVLIW